MKYQTMLEIIFMLLSRRRVTARMIAERFEISIRTAYRYINAIELANVPILCDRGANGGYYIADSFKLPNGFLTPNELATLGSMITSLQNELGNTREINSIKDKLFAATKTSEPVNLSFSQLIIDGSGWLNLSTYKERLFVLTRAINENTLLSIRYHDREGEITTRDIEPHALALKQGLWYVYAYCHLREDFRLFKVGRIEYATPSGTFKRRKFNGAKLDFNTWLKSKIKFVELEFEIDKSIKSDIEEWIGIENVKTLSNEKIVASVCLPNERGLVYEILKYGSKLKVVKPKSIRKQLLEAATELVNLYKSPKH